MIQGHILKVASTRPTCKTPIKINRWPVPNVVVASLKEPDPPKLLNILST